MAHQRGWGRALEPAGRRLQSSRVQGDVRGEPELARRCRKLTRSRRQGEAGWQGWAGEVLGEGREEEGRLEQQDSVTDWAEWWQRGFESSGAGGAVCQASEVGRE